MGGCGWGVGLVEEGAPEGRWEGRKNKGEELDVVVVGALFGRLLVSMSVVSVLECGAEPGCLPVCLVCLFVVAALECFCSKSTFG